MEEKNYRYITNDVLPRFGVGSLLNEEVKRNMTLDLPKFEVTARLKDDTAIIFYAFIFEKNKNREAGQNNYYFLNAIRALYMKEGLEPRLQTFPLYNQKGYNVDEMKSLLSGEPIYKIFSKDGKQIGAWRELDFENKNDKGNFLWKYYQDNVTNFNLVRELSKLPIRATQEQKEDMLKNMQCGIRPEAFIRHDNSQIKVTLQANPKEGTVNIYNDKGERIYLTKSNLQVVSEEKVKSIPESTKQLVEKVATKDISEEKKFGKKVS